MANFLASSVVNWPVITAFPPMISCCTTGGGQEIGASSKNIPKGLLIFLLVISANFLAPTDVNTIDTCAPELTVRELAKVTWALFKSAPVKPVGLNIASKATADLVASAEGEPTISLKSNCAVLPTKLAAAEASFNPGKS